jgi:hypothetical protein
MTDVALQLASLNITRRNAVSERVVLGMVETVEHSVKARELMPV